MPGSFFAEKRTFVFFAVPEGGSLCGINGRDEFLLALRGRSAEVAGLTADKRAELVFPWEWDSPRDFSGAEGVLGGDSWNRICLHIVKNFGNFKYSSKKCKAIHALTEEKDLAFFKITARVRRAKERRKGRIKL